MQGLLPRIPRAQPSDVLRRPSGKGRCEGEETRVKEVREEKGRKREEREVGEGRRESLPHAGCASNVTKESYIFIYQYVFDVTEQLNFVI